MLLSDNGGRKNLSHASKTALGGMMSALSVIVLIPSALEILVYVLPMLAGLITMLCVIELSKKWALGVYAATSAISLLIVPNKEAVVMYVAFFGYYPIIKAVFESKLPKALEYLLKFIVFNLSIVIAYFLLIKLFGIPFETLFDFGEDFLHLSKFAIPIMLFLGNIIFIGFDYVLTKYATWYLLYLQKKVHKMFRFK